MKLLICVLTFLFSIQSVWSHDVSTNAGGNPYPGPVWNPGPPVGGPGPNWGPNPGPPRPTRNPSPTPPPPPPINIWGIIGDGCPEHSPLYDPFPAAIKLLPVDQIEALIHAHENAIDIAKLYQKVETQAPKAFSPELSAQIIQEADAARQLGYSAARTDFRSASAAQVEYASNLAKSYLKAISDYVEKVVSGTVQAAKNSYEFINATFSDSKFVQAVKQYTKEYFQSRVAAFKDFQKEVIRDALIVYLSQTDNSVVSMGQRADAFVRLFNKVVLLEGVTAVPSTISRIGEGLGEPTLGSQALESAVEGLKGNHEPVVKTEFSQIEGEAKKINESAERLGIPASDRPRVINDAHHIFEASALAKHKLGGFLEKFSGDQLHAFRSLEEATQILANEGKISGIFTTTVSVKDTIVTVRGRVIDGVVRIGTAYIP